MSLFLDDGCYMLFCIFQGVTLWNSVDFQELQNGNDCIRSDAQNQHFEVNGWVDVVGKVSAHHICKSRFKKLLPCSNSKWAC